MKVVSFVALALVLAASTSLAHAATAEDADALTVVHHWTFDDEEEALAQWDGWSSPNTEGEFEWIPEGGREGSGALYIQGFGPMTNLWRVDVPVVGGTTYEFSTQVRVRDGSGYTHIAGRTKDRDGDWISGGRFSSRGQDIFLRGDTDWEELRVQFHTPDNAKSIALFLAVRFAEGDEIWFDEAKLREAVVPVVRDRGPAFAARAEESAATLSDAEALPEALDARLNTYRADLAEALEQLDAAGDAVPDIDVRRRAWSVLRDGAQVRRQLERRAQEVQFERTTDAPIATAWIDSTQRAFPDDLPLPRHTDEGRIHAFGGEHAAAQLVLVPFGGFEDVTVRATPKDSPDEGAEAIDFDWRVVGYVKMEELALNAAGVDAFPYTGWWPDPLLELDRFDLETHTYQPIWIDARVPRDAAIGEHEFEIEIVGSESDGTSRVLASTPLTVERMRGDLPEQWHLKKVLSFSTRLASEDWTSKTHVNYGERWDEVAEAFYELLLDYRIGVGSFYEPIDSYGEDTLLRAAEAGQNIFFTAAGRAREGDDGELFLAAKDEQAIDHALGPAADTLESLGLLEKSYFYSFDEHWPWTFPLAREVFERAKERGYTTMSTLHDTTYGTESILGDVLDVFVPSQSRYDKQTARLAREQGRDVWWYTTSDFNIETDLIYQRQRLWRTMAVEADGYLIWAMNRWVGNDSPLTDAVRTDWNPRLDDVTPSSSAMMIYPGEDGPVSSLRLEAFRAGVQDYDILAEAAHAMQREDERFHEATGRLLERLGVPDDGAGIDHHDIRRFRRELATFMQGE